MKLEWFRSLALAWLLVFAHAAGAEAPSPQLVLLLTMDQGRGDYLDRFRPVLHGGLGMLVERGQVFENAHHFHATTVTAAGHASLSTGLFPSHSGMVGNYWYERSEEGEVYCVEDREFPLLTPAPESVADSWGSGSRGRSPARLLGTGLADWIRQSNPDARVFSVGGKDRSAILMGGKNADAAYWYDQSSGQWVSSRYYLRAYPDWVARYQARRPAERYFEQRWEPLPVEPETLEEMAIVSSNDGFGGPGFPLSLGGATVYPDRSFFSGLFESPFIESYLFDFAEQLVVEEELGRDDAVDVLALSFSSVDSVGHDYGPNSRELLDAVMRLDRELGRFFRYLDETVGLDHVAVALAADHGTAPLPEYRRSQNLPGRRLQAADFPCFQRSGMALETQFGPGDWFVDAGYFDYELLGRRNVKRQDIERFVAGELLKCPGVARVWTRTEIEQASFSDGRVEPMLELYLHGFHPDRSPDLFVQLDKWTINRRRGTTHGSAYDYDTHVLAVLLWPGAEPARITERIHTVDLPVTLAALLGIEPPPDLDGRDRTALIR